jgi:putative peptidoglycan lipid II flippase
MIEAVDEPAAPENAIPAEVSLASTARSAAILTGATAFVQLLGIVRELVLADREGVTASFDALLIGLVLPMTLTSVLTAGVTTALVPAYIDARRASGTATARRLAGTVLAWVIIAGVLVTLALEALADPLMSIAGPGLSAAGHDEAVGYLRLLAPTTVFAAVAGVLYAVCQAEGYFKAIAVSLIVAPTTTLLTMLLLWDRLDLGAYALGSLLGPLANVLVLIVATVRHSISPRLHLVSRGLGLGAFGRHALPLTISAAVLQINAIFDRALATLIAPGAVSALRYGDTLVRVPTGAISPAWGAAIYPALVQATHHGPRTGLGTATDQAMRYVIALFVPVSALTFAVAPVAVMTAYGRGAFDEAGLTMTSLVVAGFAPLVLTLMISQTLTGALNARRSGRVLLMAGCLNVVLNCTLDVVLGLSLGIAGIALASSVTAIVVSTFKARRLAQRESDFRLRPLVRSLGLAIAASAPATLVVGAVSWGGLIRPGLLEGLVILAIFGAFGMATYLVIATRLGLAEPRVIVSLVTKRLSRTRNARPSEG